MTYTTAIVSDEPPVERTVGSGGRSAGRVYVPKAWIGREVTIVLGPRKEA